MEINDSNDLINDSLENIVFDNIVEQVVTVTVAVPTFSEKSDKKVKASKSKTKNASGTL